MMVWRRLPPKASKPPKPSMIPKDKTVLASGTGLVLPMTPLTELSVVESYVNSFEDAPLRSNVLLPLLNEELNAPLASDSVPVTPEKSVDVPAAEVNVNVASLALTPDRSPVPVKVPSVPR